MKLKVVFYLLFFSLLSCNKTTDNHPNIIIFLTDDQGWGDLSFHGNTNIQTPNIDNIAKNGVSFNRFYVSPVCSPTRAELLTGKYFVRSGVNGVTKGYERMNIEHELISDFLKKENYNTGLFGKWHNGSQPPYHPNNRGFNEFYGFTAGHWGDYFNPVLENNGKIVRGDGYIIDDITNKSISFMENSDSPFFTLITYNTPHSPMQVPDSFFENIEVNLQGRYADKENKIKTQAALAMVENIDYNVGKVINSLKKSNKYENTIIIFFSDNGPNGNRWNLEMKERKGSTNEGGVRVPFFIQWPKKIKSDYLLLDNYYRDLKHLSIEERELVNFDDPKSIDFKLFYQHLKSLMNGESVNTPTYSYKTHLRKNKTKCIGKNDVLIIDGLFILLKKKIRDFFDLTIFLNVDESTRLKRRIKRDVFERNRTENQIRERFNQMIKPMHDKFIQPSKTHADIIIDNEVNYQKIIKKIEYIFNEIIRKNKEF